MSVNKERPHVLVLPEDDANRQIARGFELVVPGRTIQNLPPAGGWQEVRDQFENTHVAEMKRNPNRFMVLVVDFDGGTERAEQIRKVVPVELSSRVFIVGADTTPEALKISMGSFETIGKALAADCRDDRNDAWSQAMLAHNALELERLRAVVAPVLFPR